MTESRDRPRVLIEDWLPVAELGIESRREAAPIPGQFPKLKTLHVWWARRPLAASAGVILASVLPAWSEDVATVAPGDPRLADDEDYRRWFLRLCGIWGDPVAAKAMLQAANAQGIKLKGNGYGYKQAFKNSPSPSDLDLLHQVLEHTWTQLPSVLDPTAGGGSIPYESARYGLPTRANDLNHVAAAVLRAGVGIPTELDIALAGELQTWGQMLCDRLRVALEAFFELEDPRERVVAYVFARTVACPRTGKLVPLAPNWWISKEKGKEIAVTLVAERGGRQLSAPEFEILYGKNAVASSPDTGTVAGGDALSPWDGLVIDGGHIKAEAQAGRLGSTLYAVAIRVPEPRANGKTKWVRKFRPPTQVDQDAIERAEKELASRFPGWVEDKVVPSEEIPAGLKTAEPLRYGMTRWIDMFSPRQLLVHGTFAEEFQRLIPEVTDALGEERANAVLGLLGMIQGKFLDWNSMQCTWESTREKIGHTFQAHNFAMRYTFAEFEGARELGPWALSQLVDAYSGIAELLVPGTEHWALGSETFRGEASDLRHPVPGPVTVTRGSAGDLRDVADGSQTLVCIDPPYYDNVMYAELSDFFGVWEQHTIGRVWPDLMPGGLADTKNEAVANPARFGEFGRRKKELANQDYQAKMAAIFTECHRVLRDDGVMTVMFTHKRAEAWDTLGTALLQAGFSIETSWPVNTESEQSLHQAKKNAAASTIMLVCRKRPEADGDGQVFFEDVEAEVRAVARDAATRFEAFGIQGVDLLLASYGPVLSVLSQRWPVYSAETDDDGRSRLLRPEEALDSAREEIVRLRRHALVGRAVDFDPVTDFVLLAWETFRAEEFPYDEARRLALAIGGGDVETMTAAKVVEKKSGTVKLLAPSARKRKVHRPVVEGEYASLPLIDVLHAVMIEAETSGLGAAKALCDRLGLLSDGRFVDLIQAMVRAVPNSKTKGKWLRKEAEVLHALCTAYLPDIELPEDPTVTELFPET